MDMLDELKNAQNKVVGLKQLLRELEADNVVCVFVADDAEVHLKEKISTAVPGGHVKIAAVESMDKLGETCGIEVGAACAGILKK
ncbi:ribosomal L7Ae/L30e/S12e/Gadd45 family protein [Christensenellaceae bacterium OttesenSCG-928-K19]|nr:ribosomal L7Ae/L30e/S12e/Gadd45 family protein [Christensenellaceae bacterium OttesenSCG-928-K19]